MKQFFKVLADLIDTIGRARAAASLARMHKYEEAKKYFN
jgi:hypothetical protein